VFTIYGLRSNPNLISCGLRRPSCLVSYCSCTRVLLCWILQRQIQPPDKNLAAVELFLRLDCDRPHFLQQIFGGLGVYTIATCRPKFCVMMTVVLSPRLISDNYAPQRAGHASLPGPTAPLVTELLQLPVPMEQFTATSQRCWLTVSAGGH